MVSKRRPGHTFYISMGNTDSLSQQRGPYKGEPSAIADARRLTGLLRARLAEDQPEDNVAS